jgi:hypothetical protein
MSNSVGGEKMSRKRAATPAQTTEAPTDDTTTTKRARPDTQQLTETQLRHNTRTQQALNAETERRYCDADLIYGIMLGRDGGRLASIMTAIASIVRARIARYRQIFASASLPATARTVPDSDLDKLNALLGRLVGERAGSVELAPPNDPWARTAKQAFFWIAFGLEHGVRTKLMPRVDAELDAAADDDDDEAAEARRPKIDPVAGTLFLVNDFKAQMSKLILANGRTAPDCTAFVRECIVLYTNYLPPTLPEYREAAAAMRKRKREQKRQQLLE